MTSSSRSLLGEASLSCDGNRPQKHMDWWKLKTPGPDLFREETQKSAFEQALKGDFTQEQNQTTRSRHIARHLPMHGLGFWKILMCQRHAVRINTFVWSGLTKSVFSCIFQVARFQTVSNCSTLGFNSSFWARPFFFPPSQRLADHNVALTAGDERLALESLEVEADCRSKST